MINKKSALVIAGFLFALNVFVWQEVFVLNHPQYLKVDFLNVGQGDSEFIETPHGHQILIDGGPNSAVLEKLALIMPFWDKEIDMVILTHPEKDHMAGILDVLQRYNVEYFVWTGILKDSAENKKLAELLKEKNALPGVAESHANGFWGALSGFLPRSKKQEGLKTVTVSAGDRIKAGDVFIDILYPFENLSGQQPKNVNNTSIVAKLFYGNRSFLFTGDIDSKTEKEIIKNSESRASANVLKVAHHGSKYSTSNIFLQAVRPNMAVIEVGKNSYGHPTEDVLNMLENFGIQIKRTDKDGDVKFLSDGKIIKLEN